MRHLECVRVCGDKSRGGGDDGTSAEVCQRTKFGLTLDEPPPSRFAVEPHLNCTITPSVVASADEKFPPGCLRQFDVVILSEAAHWVGVDGALGLQQCLERRGLDAPTAARDTQSYVAQLYEQQMRRNAEHLRSISAEPALRRTRFLFRTAPPGYPTADLLPPDTTDGVPPVYTAPSASLEWVDRLGSLGTSRFNHHMIPRLNGIARRAFLDAGLGVMDVQVPMSYRVDGHLDPLHYCLPGPVDFYAEVLYNHVL